jgi:glucose/arabinose dehydrogenase
VQRFLTPISRILSRRSKQRPRRSYRRQRLGFESLEEKRLLTIVPTGFTETLVASALSSPTSLATAHDGRIFIAQQNGTIRLIKNDALSSIPFASLTTDSTGERGLLGITLDPDFENNGYLYVFYTATGPSRMRLGRLTAEGDSVLPGSEQVLLELPPIPSSAIWRMGGALNFGPDGKLYVAVGDEQDTDYPQSLDNPF